jgi:hypothetical protein
MRTLWRWSLLWSTSLPAVSARFSHSWACPTGSSTLVRAWAYLYCAGVSQSFTDHIDLHSYFPSSSLLPAPSSSFALRCLHLFKAAYSPGCWL